MMQPNKNKTPSYGFNGHCAGGFTKKMRCMSLPGLILTLLLSLSLGCTAIMPEIEQTPTSEADAQTSIKAALIDAVGTDAAAISVLAEDGVVTLGGFVESEEVREAVLKAARSSRATATIVDEMKTQ